MLIISMYDSVGREAAKLFENSNNFTAFFGGDVEPNSFFLHTIPVRKFTPIHMLNFILDSQQKSVDYIRNSHERYIVL